jgi:HSP20 family molecular chaperone IbpA
MYEDPQDMFREMDEMFARLFTRMNQDGAGGESQMFGYHIVITGGDDSRQVPEESSIADRAGSEPVAEVHTIGEEVKVIVELPGAAAESVTLDVQDQNLIIDADGCMTHYHTTASLPPVNAATMQSSFRNGVLEVTFGILPENPEVSGAGEN